MKRALCHLESFGSLLFGRYHGAPKKHKETPSDYEKRTWREKAHFAENGKVCIPSFMFKSCLSEAASYDSKKIPGKGSATYTKHIKAGVVVPEDLTLEIRKKELIEKEMFLLSDPSRKKGARVHKIFPFVKNWEGVLEVQIIDDTVTKDVFTDYLTTAGLFIGVGSMRPINNGEFGRFKCTKIEWEDIEI